MVFILMISTISFVSVTALSVPVLQNACRANCVVSSSILAKSKCTALYSSLSDPDSDGVKDRPFTLPAGQFKPKQSLGQNFLSDQNYVLKICDAFVDKSSDGHRVVEIGPGPGALTRVLYQRYPSMTAIEIDQRAVAFLGEKIPGINTLNRHLHTRQCFITYYMLLTEIFVILNHSIFVSPWLFMCSRSAYYFYYNFSCLDSSLAEMNLRVYSFYILCLIRTEC